MKAGSRVTIKGVIASDILTIPLKNGLRFVGYRVKVKGYDEPILIYESEIALRHDPHMGSGYLTDTDFDAERSFFQKNLRSYRRWRKLTQVQLADELKAARNSINNWENGHFLPRPEWLLRIADHMDISMTDLMTKEVEWK